LTTKINKTDLINFLKGKVADEIQYLKKQLFDLKETTASESKSSAGDKYETGIEMLKQEEQKIAERLLEATKKRKTLEDLRDDMADSARLGAIVKTAALTMFISIPFGKIEFQGEEIYCLSVNAPVAKSIMNKKTHEFYLHQGKQVFIENLY
jgi:hypothetical protein